MKKGIKVLYLGKLGISLGLVRRFGVEWVLIECPDGSRALVREDNLEVINGNTKTGNTIREDYKKNTCLK